MLPSLVAVNVPMVDPEATSRRALAGGFTVALAVHPNVDSAIAGFTNAVVDIGFIASQARSRTVSGSPRRGSKTPLPGVAADDDVLSPVAFTAAIPESASADSVTGLLNDFARTLLPGALIVVDSGAAHLNGVLLFAMLYDRSVHVINIRSIDALTVVRKAKSRGIKVTCSISLATLFDADANPDTVSFWQCAKDIDVVTISHDEELDGVSEFDLALPLLFGAVRDGKISKNDIVRWLSVNPAQIFSIELDSTSCTEYDTFLDHADHSTPLHHARAKSKIFTDARLCGRVTRTMLHGEPLFVDGAVFAQSGKGEIISASLGDGSISPLPSLDGRATSRILPLSSAAAAETDVDHLDMSSTTKLRTFRHVQEAMKGCSILNVGQFSRQMLHVVYGLAQRLKQEPDSELMKGKVLASIFYEASTRTSCSFSSAMQRLGGAVIPINQIGTTSVSKGESLHDFVRTMECYADAIVLRHPEKGSVAEAAGYSVETPILNAGDGTGEHPTQALLDVFTIREELGTVNNLTITMLGDLKHGRTVHSLARLLSQYNVTIRYVSPDTLRMPKDIIDYLRNAGIKQTEHSNILDVIGETDVLYVTRLQRERFENLQDVESVDKYTVDTALLTKAKKHMVVMHPLPRVDEISSEVDSDPRAAYFRQMQNGVYVRMALLALVLGVAR